MSTLIKLEITADERDEIEECLENKKKVLENLKTLNYPIKQERVNIVEELLKKIQMTYL